MKRKVLRWWFKKRVGAFLHFIGKPCGYSTDISGASSCGYGDLDNNGFWQFPYYPKAKRT